MKIAGWITLFYGLLILFGGAMGQVQAGSTISLIIGSIFSLLLILCGVGMLKDHLLPAYFGILLILILDAFFTYRWLYTFKFFPAGLMSLISLGVFIIVANLIRNHLRKQRQK